MNIIKSHGSYLERRLSLRVSVHTVVLILFLFYLIGAHLRLSIYWNGNILLPMYPMLLSSAVLAFLFIKKLLYLIGIGFFIFTVFVITQPLLSFAPESISYGTFAGSLQILVSIISSLAVIFALSTVDQARLRQFLIIVWSLLIILAVVESIGLKPIFDMLREWLYSGSGRTLYLAEERDIEIYGRVRTTVLASEPSFLADSLAGLILMVFFLGIRNGSLNAWLLLGFMVVVSFILSPSFKMIFYLIAVFVWQFWPRNLRDVVIYLIILLFLGLVLLFFFSPIFSLIQQVLGGHLGSGSFYGRIGVAPAVGWDALTNYPIYGYGIGNEEGVYPIITQKWHDSGAFSLFPWYQGLSATDLMSNGFWWQWIFLGLVGNLIFSMFILYFLGRLGVDKPLRTLVCVWIVWYAGFAFVDPHSWYILVIFSIGAISFRQFRRSYKYVE